MEKHLTQVYCVGWFYLSTWHSLKSPGRGPLEELDPVGLWARLWWMVLIVSINVGRYSLKVSGTISWVWVLGYVKEERGAGNTVQGLSLYCTGPV